MESSGCKSRTAKASMQAGSECCHSPGDWWVRSVHSKEAGREDSAPKSILVAMPTPLALRKAVSGTTAMRGRFGVAGVPSSGHASHGFPRNPGELSISSSYGRYRPPRETGGGRGWMVEQSYRLIVPMQVGNRRAPATGGHGTH